MRRIIGSLLLVSCVMSACTPTPSQPRKPVTPKATTKPTATVTPTPRASATPARPAASTKPTLIEGPTTLMTGKVEIDAHYIIANNAGAIIANGGGNVIALKGGTLISDNGLGLISDNGLGLISDNGLGLIANNGAGLVSNNAGSFRLLQTSNVPLGTMLPVKGMAVIPIAMRTGEIVGKPVFTDGTGTYELAVPKAVMGSIRLVARVPVMTKDDPFANDVRAQYNLVLETTAKGAVIDEDTSVTSRYVRACFANRLKEIMKSTDPDKTSEDVVQALGFDAGLTSFLSATVKEVNTAAKTAGVDGLSAYQLDELAQRMTDVLISYVKFESLEIDPAKFDQVGPKEFALVGMNAVIGKIRAAATAKMLLDPEHFNTLDFVKSAKWTRTIKKPSDVCDFVVDNYLLDSGGKDAAAVEAFTGIGVPLSERARLTAIYGAILIGVGQTLLTSPEAKAEGLVAVRATKP
jgi:hypothetical protein